MEKLIFIRKALEGVLILDSNDPIIITILSGMVGSIICALVTIICTSQTLKKEKSYYIELEVLTDRIFNPLLKILSLLEKRRELNAKELISEDIFLKIDELFENNACWCFIVNTKLKSILIEIERASSNRDQIELYDQLIVLKKCIRNLFLKKYKF